VPDVVREVAEPAQHAGPGGVERALERGRVAEQGVGRRQCTGEGVDREPGALDVVPVAVLVL